MERSGNQAQADELQKDPAQVAPRSAGQCGGWQRLSPIVDAAEESAEELSDTNRSWESAAVESGEDAAHHPERPAHTHEEYSRADDRPPKAARQS